MRKWLMIGGAGAVVGYAAVSFALSGLKPEPQPQPESAVLAPAPAEPVVLPHVVEVTDVDPLLDPPLDPLPGQPAGIPFDPTGPLEPQTAVNAFPDGLPVAPAPRAVN